MKPTSIEKIRLDNFWPYQVAFLADQVMRHTLNILKSESTLNTSQWRVLAAVVDKPGRSAADVTAITPMDKTIVSRAVRTLIKDGVIQKKQSNADKRIMSLTPTKTGVEIYTRIASRLMQALEANNLNDPSAADFITALKEYRQKMDKIPRS